jgi:hypothetical protein
MITVQKVAVIVEVKDNATAPVHIRYLSRCKGGPEVETSVCDNLHLGDQVLPCGCSYYIYVMCFLSVSFCLNIGEMSSDESCVVMLVGRQNPPRNDCTNCTPINRLSAARRRHWTGARAITRCGGR